jgi:hypothetical protein
LKEALAALKGEKPLTMAWYCITAARTLIEKQHPEEKIDWDSASGKEMREDVGIEPTRPLRQKPYRI